MAVRFLNLLFVLTLLPLSAMGAPKKSENAVSIRAVETTRDANFVYNRTPLQYMAYDQRKRAMKTVVRLLDEKLNDLRKSGKLPEALSVATLPLLESAHKNIDELVETLLRLELNQVDASKKSFADFIPSALIINVLAKGTLGLGVAGGAGVSVGLVVLPYHVTRQPLQNDGGQNTVEYYEFEYFLIGFPNVDIGGGASAGAVTRISLGAIWGPMESPKDFLGLMIALSGGFATPAGGVNVKTGAVHNSKKPGAFQYKFAMAGLEWGAGVNVEARVNAAWIVDGMKFLAGLGIEGLDDTSVTTEKIEVSGTAGFKEKEKVLP